MFNGDKRTVRTNEVRLSYVHLNEPYANASQPNNKPKYSVSMWIPKTDTAKMEEIRQAIREAGAEAQSKVWGGLALPESLLMKIIHDGDGVNESGKPYGDEAKGCWVINTTATIEKKPPVFRLNPTVGAVEICPEAEIYSGMYAVVTVQFYGTKTGGNKMCCGLQAVVKTRDGDPLTGRTYGANDFADLLGTAAGATLPGQQINPITGLPM